MQIDTSGSNVFYSVQAPLAAMPARTQMRAGNFVGFLEFVRRHGGDPRRILERHGIDPLAVADPESHIDCKSFVSVLAYCSTLLNDPLFGLRLAGQQEPDIFGCVTALCRAAPTLREAIRCFRDYIPVVHSPRSQLELVEGNEIAELRYAACTDCCIDDQSNYQAALLTTKLLRQIGGRDFSTGYVALTVNARPKDISDIEVNLGCSFRRSSGRTNAIAFPVSALEQPVASSNHVLFRLLGGYLDRVKAATRTTILERVEDYIQEALPLGTCSIQRCANKLGLSERSLQLHLIEHGMKFSDLLQQQRLELAERYLKQKELSLNEVAYLLGYSEQSSFGRAFRRWTGQTPQDFRAGR